MIVGALNRRKDGAALGLCRLCGKTFTILPGWSPPYGHYSFICTRGDLLSGNIGRILRLHPSQTIFVDRVVLANIVASGITVWGEALLPPVPVAPIRRFDVFK